MSSLRRVSVWMRVALILGVVVLGLTTRRLLQFPAAVEPAVAATAMDHGEHMAMSDDEMRRMIRAQLAGRESRTQLLTSPPVDSFRAMNFRFERDGSAATQVDTAFISVGQTIRFKWVSGFHTAFSGTDSSDPDLGLLFQHSLTSAADNFDFQFDSVGSFPFFCTVHENRNMRGIVVVTAPVSVTPIAGAVANVGFVIPPSPNPTRSGSWFRFALARPGRVRADVIDVNGRRIVTLLDRDLVAGQFAASWDGRTSAGARVPPGVYSIRLSLPGLTQVRRVAVER